MDFDAFFAASANEPTILTRLVPGQVGGEAFDVLGVLADEVAAGGPDGHEELDFGRGGWNRRRHFDVMVLSVGEAHGISDGFAHKPLK